MQLTSPVFADRSDRGKLRLTGEQRAWFLHQILTQSIEDMTPGEARDAALLTPHGRMLGYMEILVTEEALLAHFEPDLGATLPARMLSYVFATRVSIDDVTEDKGLVLVAGPGALEWARGQRGLVHPTRALGDPAAYVWIDRDSVAETLDAAGAAGFAPAGEAELERVRVANGVPRWGRDMDQKTLPQEAGIDALAVHYTKGCYVGQEAMAKIHFRGKVNRRLRLIEADAALPPDAEVHAGGARVGRVTSAAGRRALAMMRATVDDGDEVTVGAVHATVVG